MRSTDHLSSEPAILWPRKRSNSEQCAAFILVQLYIECTILATMPNYAGSSKKLYQNENYVGSNHNDIKTAFIPFRNKEINVCLATNSSPACCSTPNLSMGRDPPPSCAEAFNSPKCGPPLLKCPHLVPALAEPKMEKKELIFHFHSVETKQHVFVNEKHQAHLFCPFSDADVRHII